MFLPILVFSVSADFRLFWCHFVKSHQLHSPLCFFFNLQKHTRKKNENQRAIIFRISLMCEDCFSDVLFPVPFYDIS